MLLYEMHIKAYALIVKPFFEAVYESSPLQLRLRDLLVGSQHLVAQKRQYVTSGKLLLETDPA
jgi:hypothetical protein